MVTKDQVLELVPHYVAMVLLVLFVMTLIRAAIGTQHILVEFAFILALVFAYRPLIVRLDIVPTPTVWEEDENDTQREG